MPSRPPKREAPACQDLRASALIDARTTTTQRWRSCWGTENLVQRAVVHEESTGRGEGSTGRCEAQAMARLTRPNVVTLRDIGAEDGQPYVGGGVHGQRRCRGIAARGGIRAAGTPTQDAAACLPNPPRRVRR